MRSFQVAPAEETTPIEALRWYGHHIHLYWRWLTRLEIRLHNEMLLRYPKSVRSVERILQIAYAIAASPISAVILALLLVALVISEVVGVIVSVSMLVAWIVFLVAAARTRAVKELPILRRTAALLVLAFVSFGASRLYVKWVLRSYYYHHRSETISARETSNQNPDELLIERMKQIFREEISKQLGVKGLVSRSAAQNPGTQKSLASLSSESLTSMAQAIDDSLRRFAEQGWYGRDREIELKSYADLEHERWKKAGLPPTKTQAEWQNEARTVDSYYRTKLIRKLADASAVREALLTKLPVEAQIPVDTIDAPALIAKAIAESSLVPSGTTCCPDSIRGVAQYLDALAKRVSAANTPNAAYQPLHR